MTAGEKLSDMLFWAEFGVKIGLICFLFVVGFIFINKRLKEEETKGQRYFSIGIAMLAFMSGLTRIFFVISDFQIEYSATWNLLWRMATGSSFLAVIFIALVIETYLVKTKYLCSIIGIVGTIIVIFVNVDLARSLMAPIYLILGAEIVLLYLYVAYKSPGTLRTKALLMILSLIIFLAGIIFDSSSLMESLGIGFDTGIFGAILMWIGLGYYLKLNYS
jgi:hypothetical protein